MKEKKEKAVKAPKEKKEKKVDELPSDDDDDLGLQMSGDENEIEENEIEENEIEENEENEIEENEDDLEVTEKKWMDKMYLVDVKTGNMYDVVTEQLLPDKHWDGFNVVKKVSV